MGPLCSGCDRSSPALARSRVPPGAASTPFHPACTCACHQPSACAHAPAPTSARLTHAISREPQLPQRACSAPLVLGARTAPAARPAAACLLSAPALFARTRCRLRPAPTSRAASTSCAPARHLRTPRLLHPSARSACTTHQPALAPMPRASAPVAQRSYAEPPRLRWLPPPAALRAVRLLTPCSARVWQNRLNYSGSRALKITVQL
jgi:hypothetical protein